jgi:TolB-like protein
VKTIAVLPFRNVGLADDDVIAEELTEDLIDTLSMTRGLKVRPHSMVTCRLPEGRDALAIGRALDVDVVVEGSVRRAGSEIRVTARLISVPEGFQLWAQRFERPATDLLVVNDEAARAVVAALLLDLTAPPRQSAPDTATIEVYVSARHALRAAWNGIGDPAPAVALFERGLARAPSDPSMLSGYAMARARLFNYEFTEMSGEPDRTRAVVDRAIALAPHLGETWLARAVLLHATSDWVGAVTALRAALDCVPGLLKARKMLASMQLEVGLLNEGLAELENIEAVQPTAVSLRWEIARGNALLDRAEQTGARLELPVEHEPDKIGRAIVRARMDLWRREVRYPIPAMTEATTDAGRRGLTAAIILGDLVRKGGMSPGDAARFERMAEETGHPRSRLRTFSWQLAAEVFAFAGDHERTARAITHSVESSLFDLSWLDRCPLLDSVRAEAWFVALRARVAVRVRTIVAAFTASSASDRARTIPPDEVLATPRAEPTDPMSPRDLSSIRRMVAPTFVLRREGEYFTVEHAGRTARLKVSVGLDLLARLVDNSGQEFPAIVLAAPGNDLPLGNAGEMLDAQAMSAYKDRLEDLREQLTEAEEMRDSARATRAREEIDALATELARGLGLGGRVRVAGSAAERARINVQRHVRKAIRKIAEDLPDLGRYLDWTVKTGNFCVYQPPE